MNNQTLIVKFMQRLDKLSSSDYGNIEQWMMIEAFNKGTLSWVRRQLEGINQTKSGAEGSTRRIDDLQYILTTSPLEVLEGSDESYWYSLLPEDYLQWSRVSASGKNNCCPPRKLVVFEAIEADLDMNLSNNGKRPNFDWATTFATVSNKTVKIFTNGEFDILDASLTYYKTPINIQIAGIVNPSTGEISVTDVECEAADNIIELLIEEGVGILLGDLSNFQKEQITTQRNERNT